MTPPQALRRADAGRISGFLDMQQGRSDIMSPPPAPDAPESDPDSGRKPARRPEIFSLHDLGETPKPPSVEAAPPPPTSAPFVAAPDKAPPPSVEATKAAVPAPVAPPAASPFAAAPERFIIERSMEELAPRAAPPSTQYHAPHQASPQTQAAESRRASPATQAPPQAAEPRRPAAPPLASTAQPAPQATPEPRFASHAAPSAAKPVAAASVEKPAMPSPHTPPQAPRPPAPQPQIFRAEPSPERPAAPPPRAPLLMTGAEAPPSPYLSAQDAPPPDQAADLDAAPAASSAAMLGRGSSLGRLFWWAFGGFVGLALSLAAYETVMGLLTRNVWLGRVALGLLIVALQAVLRMAAREFAGLARLRRVEETQILAARAVRHGDRPAAESALKDLEALSAGRPEFAAARERVKALKGDQPDAAGLIALAERNYLAGPDAAARAVAARSARNAAVATALIPAGILDAAVILFINLNMIRKIAESYGGRGGWLGGWRLTKQVAAHMAATGAVALADDMLGPILGGGALAKVSRRFGEGLLNGALTARVSVAAMEVCRPLPFHALPKPSARALTAVAIKGLTDRSGAAPVEREPR